MSERTPEPTSEPFESPPVQDTAGDPSSPPTSRAPSLLAAWAALLLSSLIAVMIKFAGQDFDHQNANLAGVAVFALGLLVFLVQLQRRFWYFGRPYRVPLGVLATILLLIVCFRFDGFSGELVPQLRFRFAPQRDLPLQRAASETSPDETTGSESPEILAARSPQFLGPQRNGVIARREFAVPDPEQQIEVLWDQGIGEGWGAFAVAGGRAVTLEQREQEECLTCYRLSDGELLWIRRHDGRHENPMGGVGPRSTPTIDRDRVYATTATGYVWCVDLQTGEDIWTLDLLATAGWEQTEFEQAASWGYAGSPLLTDGYCILAMGGPVGEESAASLIAVDAESGEVRWRSGDDQLSYASPMMMLLSGQRQVVIVNESSVSGHAIRSGQVLWTFSWPGSSNAGATCSSAIQVGEDRVLVGKGYGGGSALVRIKRDGDRWVAEDVWRSNRLLKTKFNHTCVDGEIGYGISNGALEAVDLSQPKRLWIQPRSSRAGQGHVLLAEDTLIIQDEMGDVVFADATTDRYHELLRLPALDAKTWNIPTLAGRILLVRNDRHAICYRLPPRADI
ncbi:outer membrane protein assembly factor BamB family protein [Roseiconus nitratireducens]|uniref:outer membrane protein assembly factor BamB family protein n=1 Tax=Roseiconus nitratireducens TaxID=2605748 RepID=UPI0013756AC3|nr:PQQ-binding-like beta-propeller repeat protein [Roseiconus nitratireducens]